MMSIMRKNKTLSARFYRRPTLRVAHELLGKFLVRRRGRRLAQAMITDVEAYVGPEDRASHASRGKTERTKTMFGHPGYWYVYLVYGMHYCLNIVTEKEHYPAAILIRGVESAGKRIAGPGRVTKFFGIDKTFNEKKASPASGLWIEDRGIKMKNPALDRGTFTSRQERITGATLRQNPMAFKSGVKPRSIKRGKRIGVEYAGKWKEKLWRFYLD